MNGQTVTFQIGSVIIDPVNSAPDTMLPYFWINEWEFGRLTEGLTREAIWWK